MGSCLKTFFANSMLCDVIMILIVTMTVDVDVDVDVDVMVRDG
jgi:hypothetical protein